MTLKRVRVYSILIAMALWAVVAVDYASPGVVDRFGKIKGTDFVQFYTAGWLLRSGQADRLYDAAALQNVLRDIVPGARETVYLPIQSPELAILFAPLAASPYGAALTIWLLLLTVLYAISCRLLWMRCGALHAYRREAVGCAIAFPGLYATVIHGQTSVFALLALTGALLALERGRRFAAGLALGCLVFKPHWIVAAGIVFLLAREWRVIAVVCVSALAQTGATLVVVGPKVLLDYLTTLQSVGRFGDLLEPRPGYSLKSFFTVFVPNWSLAIALYAVAALAVAAMAARIWRADARFDLRASSLVLAIVLVNPHVFEYDLLVLAPAFFLLANALAEGAAPEIGGRAWTWALAALFVAPILTAIPPPVRLQCSVTVMTAILFRMWRSAKRQAAPMLSGGAERLGELPA
jgi:hypothetical protein